MRFRNISIVVLLLLAVLVTSCRRTKMCECKGYIDGREQTIYMNVEHSFRCKDISRTGYETLEDSIFVRRMTNLTCQKYKEEE